MFLSKSFTILALGLYILSQFVYMVWDVGVQLHSFAYGYPAAQILFVKKLLFPHWTALEPLSKVIWP